jgi:hypothetical protein
MKKFIKIFTINLSIFIFLILFCFVCFSLYIAYKAYHYPLRSNIHYPSLITPDDIRGYKLKTQLDLNYPFGLDQHYQIFSDLEGNRVSVKNSPIEDKIDILAVGDSQTFGHGVNYEDTFIARVGSKFNLKELNAAVSGYGGLNSILTVEKNISKSPKIIVLGYYHDHAIRSLSKCYPGFSFSCLSVPHIKIVNQNSIFIKSKDNTNQIELLRKYNAYITGNLGNYSFIEDFKWRARRSIADFFQKSPIFFGRRIPNLNDEEKANDYLFNKLSTLTKKNNIKVIVVYIPKYFDIPAEPPSGYLKLMANKYNFEFLDMTKSFIEEIASGGIDSIMIKNDGHLNENGHKLIADNLFSIIKNNIKN